MRIDRAVAMLLLAAALAVVLPGCSGAKPPTPPGSTGTTAATGGGVAPIPTVPVSSTAAGKGNASTRTPDAALMAAQAEYERLYQRYCDMLTDDQVTDPQRDAARRQLELLKMRLDSLKKASGH